MRVRRAIPQLREDVGEAKEAFHLLVLLRLLRRAWPAHRAVAVRKKEGQQWKEEADEQSLEDREAGRRRICVDERLGRLAHIVDPLLLERVRKLVLFLTAHQVAAARHREARALVEMLSHDLDIHRRHAGRVPQAVKAPRLGIGARELGLLLLRLLGALRADRALQVRRRKAQYIERRKAGRRQRLLVSTHFCALLAPLLAAHGLCRLVRPPQDVGPIDAGFDVHGHMFQDGLGRVCLLHLHNRVQVGCEVHPVREDAPKVNEAQAPLCAIGVPHTQHVFELGDGLFVEVGPLFCVAVALLVYQV